VVDTPTGNFAHCFILPLDGSPPQAMQDRLGFGQWTHTVCQVQAGGDYVAVIQSTTSTALENLPDTLTYGLYMVPANFLRAFPISSFYRGFDLAPLGFSNSRGQVVLQEGRALVVVSLAGPRRTLVNIADLALNPESTIFRFGWQP
jgi:hypothetical protein